MLSLVGPDKRFIPTIVGSMNERNFRKQALVLPFAFLKFRRLVTFIFTIRAIRLMLDWIAILLDSNDGTRPKR